MAAKKVHRAICGPGFHPGLAGQAVWNKGNVVRGMTGKCNYKGGMGKQRAILQLKMAIDPYTPEEKLWFEVIAQAIKDMGLKFPLGSDYFFKRKQPITWICDNLDIDPSIIFRTLKKCEVL